MCVLSLSKARKTLLTSSCCIVTLDFICTFIMCHHSVYFTSVMSCKWFGSGGSVDFYCPATHVQNEAPGAHAHERITLHCCTVFITHSLDVLRSEMREDDC